MTTAFLDSGQTHISYGLVTVGTAPTYTGNDGSITVAQVATGEYTVTFGEVFLSAPTVTCGLITEFGTATVNTDAGAIALESVATNAVTFNIIDLTDGTQGVLSDLGNFYFMAVGNRNR